MSVMFIYISSVYLTYFVGFYAVRYVLLSSFMIQYAVFLYMCGFIAHFTDHLKRTYIDKDGIYIGKVHSRQYSIWF